MIRGCTAATSAFLPEKHKLPHIKQCFEHAMENRYTLRMWVHSIYPESQCALSSRIKFYAPLFGYVFPEPPSAKLVYFSFFRKDKDLRV